MQDTLVNGRTEQDRFLADNCHMLAEPPEIECADIFAVQEDLAFHGQVKTLQETNNCRLSGSRSSNKCHHLSSSDAQIEVLKHDCVRSRWVDVLQILELQVADKVLGNLAILSFGVDW